MSRTSRYPGLAQTTKEYVEKALCEGDDAITAREELAIARLASNDVVAMWAAARESDKATPQTKELANTLVIDSMERVASIALTAARAKAAMTPATVINVIVPIVQRAVAIVYAELANLPDFAERIHRRISDELKMEISTPSIASVGRTVEWIDDTVPKIDSNVIETEAVH